MNGKQPSYIAYMLRVWRATSNQTEVWCASLENPHTGERLNFMSLARLFAFLEDQCSAPSPGTAPHPQGQRRPPCPEGMASDGQSVRPEA